jgi:hypothetical protein
MDISSPHVNIDRTIIDQKYKQLHQKDKELLGKLVNSTLLDTSRIAGRFDSSFLDMILQDRLPEFRTGLVEAVRASQNLQLMEYFDVFHHGAKSAILSHLTLDTTRIFTPLMSPANYESFIGDLEERYSLILKERGHRSAKLWYWRQVFQSLFSLVFAALRRVSGYERLVDFYWRKRS